MTIRAKILLALIAFMLTATAAAEAQVKWETSLDSALEAAKSQGKPLLISMHTSTEIACQRMLKNLYTDPEIVALLSEFVVLPTCYDIHDDVMKTIDGKKKAVSPLFGTISSKELRKNEADVKEKYFEKPDVKVPQHIFIGDDGKSYMSKIYELKKPAFITLLNNALILYGSKAADGMDKVTQGYLKAVKKGPLKAKRKAVLGLLSFSDQRKVDILYLTAQSLKKENEKGECVRAFGKDIFAWAAPTAMKWLRDPSEYVKNCAVVTLEEMKATEAGPAIFAMYKKAKDKGLKKDILRALGPCGDGDEKIKKLLVKTVKDRREDNRIACYLSLGYYLDGEDVQELLKKQYKKEGKSVTAKTGIIWAYTYLRDEELIPQLEALVAKEKNNTLKYLVEVAKRQILTGEGVDPAEGRSGHIKLHKVMGAILGKDKILRNRHKYWKGED